LRGLEAHSNSENSREFERLPGPQQLRELSKVLQDPKAHNPVDKDPSIVLKDPVQTIQSYFYNFHPNTISELH
jgi:hypothetical protein